MGFGAHHPDGPEIRRLGPESIPSVLDLWQRAGLHFRPEGRDSVEAFTVELQTTSSFVLGAFSGDLLVGAALGTDDGRKGWINRVAVLPSHHRTGIARDLIRACESEFDERGIGLVACLIEGHNDASLQLFESADYEALHEIVYLRKPLAGRDW